jgi:glycosyltransferase involved in cell wall biosynthesis
MSMSTSSPKTISRAPRTPEGVSVVIPCFNAARYLREAIDSVVAQQYEGPLEVLVADDGSTDGSYEIGESCGPPVRMLRQPPHSMRGTPVALNRGIRAATQPLVAILAADDVFLPGHLTVLATVLTVRPELGLVYDNSYMMTEDGRMIGPWDDRDQPAVLTPDDLLPACCFGACSVMVRRSVFDRVGLFDETLRHAEDHDMWLRIVEQYPVAYVPIYGFMYRMHGNQKSLKPTLWEVAERVLSKAVQRYPYSRRSIHKRKAVLAYRFGEIALSQGQNIRACMFLAKAGLLDPVRAFREVARRAKANLLARR